MKPKFIFKQTIAILSIGLLLASPTFAQGNKCKGTPKLKNANIICDLTVDKGICLFNGQKVSVVVELKNAAIELSQVSLEIDANDCKGNPKTFASKAKLNSETGEYTAEFDIPSSKDCLWTLDSLRGKFTNNCGESFTYTQSARADAEFTNFAILLNGHSRPAKYGQCMVFSGKTSDTTKTVRIKGLEVKYEVKKDEKTGGYIYGIVIGFNNTKEDKPQPIEAMIAWGMVDLYATYTLTDEDGKTETRKGHFGAKQNWNGGRILHTVGDSYPSGHIRGRRLTTIFINGVNDCGAKFNLETAYENGYNEKDTTSTWTENWNVEQYFTDECESKIHVNYEAAIVAHEGGLYLVQLELGSGNGVDIASAIVVNLELTDCSGNVKYVDIKMTYNEKTKSYTGSLAMPEGKGCNWKTTDVKMTVYNQCGDKVERGNYPTVITKMKDKIAKGDI